MTTRQRPPAVFRALLAATLHPLDRSYALADLDEEFDDRCQHGGRFSAGWWYRKQVVRSFAPAIRGRFVKRDLSERQTVTTPSAGSLVSNLLTDLRLSARMLTKTPLILFVTVASLGVGIGVVTITFALVNEIIVRKPVGLESPDRLVSIYRGEDDGGLYGGTSYADYVDVSRDLNALHGVAAITARNVAMDGPFEAVSLFAEGVSPNYFEVTGIRPVVGRVFTSHDQPGEDQRVAVISHDLWTRSFGGRRDVVGSPVRINGHAFTVIGVAPDGVNSRRVPLETDLWIPLGSLQGDGLIPEAQRLDRTVRTMSLFGRLAPDATIGTLQAQADVLGARLAAEYAVAWADERGEKQAFTVVSEAGSRIKPGAKRIFGLLGVFFVGTASLILLLACANVAGLFVARARRRATELAVRVSLGASRGRIIRMMLAEGLLPGLLSGALGVGIALGATRMISAVRLPVQIPVRLDAELTPGVLVFAFGLSILASLTFSLLPALTGSNPQLQSALKAGSDAASGARGRWFSMKNGLVIVQCATSAILLVGATLFIRTLDLATSMDLGFDPTNVAVATMRLDEEAVSPREGVQYIRDLRARLAMEEGVESVAMATGLELTLFQRMGTTAVTVEGYQSTGGEDSDVFSNAVTPGYMEMLEVPLLRGRTIHPADTEDSRPVAVVNETFANRYWPSEDALGRTFLMGEGDEARRVEIVGVTRNGTYLDFDDVSVAFFWSSIYQDYAPHFAVAVKGVTSAVSVLPLLRSELEVPAGPVQIVAPSTLESQVSIQFIHLRVASTILGWGGLFGLFLAAIGIYGVVAFSVTQRAKEMAIRIALGADRGKVVRSVAFDGLRLAGLGLALGVAVVIPTAKLARNVFFGVDPNDPLALAGGIGALLVVAALASLIPARRVTGSDPMGALRTE